jgi:hypothetical protein
VVVPSGTAYVYLVPNTVGLYFYGGHWYRFHAGYWFRAPIYSGPWVTITQAVVPRPVWVIPPDYVLGMPPHYHRIHYNDFHHHWRDWGRTRHWHNQAWYKDHSRNHWGGREFHKPEVHPDKRGPHDKGHGDRGPQDKRHVEKGPHDKGPSGPKATPDKGPASGSKVGTEPSGKKTAGPGPGPKAHGGGSPGSAKPGGAGQGAGGHGGATSGTSGSGPDSPAKPQ